ncbi:MAG: hypothetical protein IIW86_06605 [Clostridia bacterium]|nr:hypothetical protein [Clostridia bacterium]
MQLTKNEQTQEREISLSLYRDELATEMDYKNEVRKLMAVYRHEKDASFWAIVLSTLQEQRMTKKRLSDTTTRAMGLDYLTIKALKFDKRVKMYDRQESLSWFNRNVAGSERNHILLYFYAYPKEQTGGEPFYSLWSDLAREGVDVKPLKEAQAKKYGYQLH